MVFRVEISTCLWSLRYGGCYLVRRSRARNCTKRLAANKIRLFNKNPNGEREGICG